MEPAIDAPFESVRTPVDIKATVLRLLEGLSDDEWVYWCIDDKYPVRLVLPQIRRVVSWLSDPSSASVHGVLFCRCRQVADPRHLFPDTKTDEGGNRYLRRKTFNQIWIHQFLRAGVLRALFHTFPDLIPRARAMDGYVLSRCPPRSQHLYVTERNLAVFGESTMGGRLTRNCCESLDRYGFSRPDWSAEIEDSHVIMGTLEQA